jgi:hypothetical protein
VVTQLLKEALKGWSYFGLSLNVRCFRVTYVQGASRVLLRIISGVTVLHIMMNYSSQFLSLIPFDVNFLSYVALPFLGYRSFKRSISETTSFSLHLSFLLGLLMALGDRPAQGALLILAMPPYPAWIWSSFVSIFSIPPKLVHPNECARQLGYLLLSLLGFCLYFLSLGVLELTMVFGLPIYIPVLPTETEGSRVKSAENSLYEKILQSVDKGVFRFYEEGHYLLRIEKYILLLEVKSSCFGFCELVDLRGL